MRNDRVDQGWNTDGCAAPIYSRRFRSGVSRTGVSGECWSEPATPDAARNGTGNETRSCNVKSGRLREV